MNLFKNFTKTGSKKYSHFLKKVDWYFRDRKNKNFTKKILNFLKKNVNLKVDSPTVIMWELGGFEAIFRRDLPVALALNLRGYRTHFVVCDGFSNACIQNEIFKSKVNCSSCFSSMIKSLKRYEVEYSFGSSYLDELEIKRFKELAHSIDIAEIKNYKYLEISVGEQALSSLLRYKRGYPAEVYFYGDDEKNYREYFYASLVNACVANKVIKKFNPVGICSSHGMYVDYSAPIFLGFKNGINSLCWSSGYLNSHYYSFPKSENKLIPRRISDQEWEKRQKKALTKEENKKLDSFFSDRYFNSKNSDTCFFDKPEDSSFLRSKLNIDNSYPIVCLFCHLNWDACIDFSAMIFQDSYQWVIESIKKMNEIKKVNWFIKIHPSENRAVSYYGVEDEIKRHLSFMAPNVKILYSDSKINTYSLFKLIDVGITIFGSVGVELPLFGKPVIVAGESHFSEKGFSMIAKTKKQYFDVLEKIHTIEPLSAEQIELARKYAYSYFFERQVPIDILDDNHNIILDKLEQLLPSKNIVLDKICDALIYGKDVVLDNGNL